MDFLAIGIAKSDGRVQAPVAKVSLDEKLSKVGGRENKKVAIKICSAGIRSTFHKNKRRMFVLAQIAPNFFAKDFFNYVR